MLVIGEDKFESIDIRVRVKGGGHTSQIYAIRQAIAKAVVAYYAKYFDAFSALELKKTLVAYDRTLLIADPRRMEPKKFGGQGARARRQKRCVLDARLDVSRADASMQLSLKSQCYLHSICSCLLHVNSHALNDNFEYAIVNMNFEHFQKSQAQVFLTSFLDANLSQDLLLELWVLNYMRFLSPYQ